MRATLFVSIGLLLATAGRLQAQSKKEIMYVGTYSIRGSQGLYAFSFDRKTGTMKPVQSVLNTKSPSFLAVHPSGKYLYSVDENADKDGGVSSYSIEKRTGKLTYMNSQPSMGSSPCYISIDHTGKTAFVANYGGGSMATLPIQANGRLSSSADSIQDSGSGPNKQRQERAHVHSATVGPDNRFLYVADLSTDRLHILAIDPKTSTVKPAKMPFVTVKPGSGPRHFAIHPNKKYAYLTQELTSSIAVFSRNPETGALTLIQDNVPALPTGFSGENTSADIHIDPSGKFLYQSNRGANTLAIFAINTNGLLTKVADQAVEGKTPRNFLIDPKGDFVFVANQDTDNITIFRRDKKTGKLIYTGNSVSVPAPVCVIMGKP